MITQKEKEILTLLAEGEPQKMVAHQMQCSRENIKRIVKELFIRFEVVNIAELIAYTMTNGLITTQKHIKNNEAV